LERKWCLKTEEVVVGKAKDWIPGACVSIAMLVAADVRAQSMFSVRDEATRAEQVYTHETGQFRVYGNGEQLNFNVRANAGVQPTFGSTQWFVTLVAPPGERLRPGFYPDVGCPVTTFGRAAGLQVTYDNPKCEADDTIWGWVSIRQIEFDDAGNVTRLEAAYSQRVGSPTAPAWSGLLRYDAAPMSFTVSAARNSPWGRVRQENHGDTGLFRLTGDASQLYYEASVLKDHWSVVIAPRTGQALQAGSHATRAEPDAQHAALNIVRGLDSPLYCPGSRGTVDIQDVAWGDAGEVTALRARFEYRCTPRSAPLRGEIRFQR
jgi:hypothetical protein